LSGDELAKLFLASPAPMLLCTDEDGRILACNEAFTEWADRPPTAMLGRNVQEALALDPVAACERAGQNNGGRATVEAQVVHPSGETRMCVCSIAPVEVSGQACHLTSLLDVTDRARSRGPSREAKAECWEERDLAESLLNAIPDVIGLQDREHRVLRYNAAGYRFLGITPEELGNRKCYELLGRTEPCEVCATSRAIATGRASQLQKYVPELNVWLEARAYPILDDTGRVTMVIEHLRDITDHRRSVQEREQLFSMSLDLFCVAGFDGYFKQLNPAWTKVLGWSLDELLARPWIELVHPEDRAATVEADGRLASGATVTAFENRYLCRDGSYRLLSWNSFPLAPERIIYAVVRDLTETRRMQERLQHIEKMDAIGQLAGGIAHDFNNQLVGILGYSEMLSRNLTDPKLRRFAEEISAAAHRSADLTRSLLAFARKGKMRAEPLDVHALLHDLVGLLNHTLGKHIVIRYDGKAGQAIVQGDATQLQSALLNLALNARDAMPAGGELVFSTSIERLDEETCGSYLPELLAGKFLCIAVTDTGVGMDEATRKRVFEPFFTTKGSGHGLGLGLAAVYGTVQSHGGVVTLSSDVGCGTTFRVYLPLHDAAVGSRSPDREARVRQTTRGGRVMVVDDEQVVRDVTAATLREGGYQVEAFASGPAAVAHYERAWRETDVVVLDLVMPEMSGRDVFRALRQVNPAVRVILVTGFSLNGEAQSILDEGAKAFLQKPFRVEALLEAVERVLG
jgi:PAS domain S-box-containing protein